MKNGTTIVKLFFIAETPLARLYADDQNRQQWIPRSQCPHVLKHPGYPEVHEVTVKEWWLQQNPFERQTPQQQDLL